MNASPSALSLVIRVRNLFTTVLPTTLIFAPCIQLHSLQQLANDLLKKPAAKKSKRSDQASRSTASEPAPTSAAAASFSWEADPQLVPLNLIPDTEENITETYRQHWSHIRTRFSCQNRLQDSYNFPCPRSVPRLSASH